MINTLFEKSKIFDNINIIISRFFTRLKEYIRATRQNPTWFFMFTLGRVIVIRHLVSWICSIYFKRTFNHNTSYFSHLSEEEVASSVRYEGVYSGINLPSDVIEQILSFAES